MDEYIAPVVHGRWIEMGIVPIAGGTLHFGQYPLVTTKSAIALTAARECRR